MAKHGERAHSKFSASGAERWLNCPGSVALSEGVPDKSSPWAIEGTRAHELLERLMRAAIQNRASLIGSVPATAYPREMVSHATAAANFMLGLHNRTPDSELLVETRVHLKFIHPEMFGTFDGAVIDYFGTLHVFDFKYGSGHAVSATKNVQMIFYALGLAYAHHWNFKRARVWIIQPRIKGYDGPTYWEIPIMELKKYVDVFTRGVEQVEKFPDKYVAGPWCHWCKAKTKCPLKREVKFDKARTVFQQHDEREGVIDAKEENDEENFRDEKEETGRKEEKARRRKDRCRCGAPSPHAEDYDRYQGERCARCIPF
jgi:hypothetical protein